MSARVLIIGAEDWTIFGRSSDGTLLCAIVEVWPEWLSAPHKGTAEWGGTPEWAEDWRYIMSVVQDRVFAGTMEWQPCEHPLLVSDAEMIQQTRDRFMYPKGDEL